MPEDPEVDVSGYYEGSRANITIFKVHFHPQEDP